MMARAAWMKFVLVGALFFAIGATLPLPPIDEYIGHFFRTLTRGSSTGSNELKKALPVDAAIEARRALFDPKPDFAFEFVRTRPASPGETCLALARAGYANTGWQGSQVSPSEWECLSSGSDAAVPAGDAAPEPLDLFFILRGGENYVTQFFVKVSLASDADRALARTRVLNLLNTVLKATGTLPPPVFMNSILRSGWSQFVRSDGVFTWQKEHGTSLRYDLTIAFDESRGRFLQL